MESSGWNEHHSYKYISDDKVAGNQVGDLIEDTTYLLRKAIQRSGITFRAPLRSISNEAITLKLQLDKMGKDDDLMEAIINELKGIYILNGEYKALVRKCSRIYFWLFNDKHKFSYELLEFSSRMIRCRSSLAYTSSRWELELVRPKDEVVTGVVVGGLLEQTTKLMEETIRTTNSFGNRLQRILLHMKSLQYKIDTMGDNEQKNLPNEELRPIYDFLRRQCKIVMFRCMKFPTYSSNIEKDRYLNDLDNLKNELVSFCNTMDLSYMIYTKEIKDEIVVESAAGGGYGMYKLCLDKQVTETENIKGLEDVPFNNNIQDHELLISGSEPAVMVESVASPGGYENSTLDNLGNEVASFCNTIDLSYMIDTKEIKDDIVVESGGYGMNKFFLDEQVTETESNKGLEDVPFNNGIQHNELLDESKPTAMVESAASPGEYGKSTLASNEQVTAISYEYDVFLCFRGDDTRESFTSTLFYALSKVYKVKTFMDVIFKKGSKLEELLKMVEKSRMSIVVFSENFAESEWCLKELAKIFEESDRRGHEVVPVFYKVHPSELRHQDFGKTKGHMEKHHNTYGKDSDTVKSWSNAIKELGNSSGYTYWAGRGNLEIDLAEDIAQDIWTRLNGRQGYLSKPTHTIFILVLVLSFLIFYFLSAKLVMIPW